MKLLVVTPRDPFKHTGGLETLVKHTLKAIQDTGIKVQILCTGKNTLTYQRYETEIIQVKRYGINKAYQIAPKIYTQIRETDADTIHVFGYNNTTTLLTLFAVKENKKVIISLATSEPVTKTRKIAREIFDETMSAWIERANSIIAVSEYEKQEYSKRLKIPEDKIQVIEPIPTIKKTGTKYPREKTMLTISRLVKWKRIDRIIRILQHTNKEITLRIMGNGEEKQNLRKLVKQLNLEDRVLFLGNIKATEEYKEEIQKAGVFIHLADYESFGISIVDALTLNTPTILAENTQMKKYIKENDAIGIQNTKNYRGIARVIDWILIDKGKAKTRYKPNTIENLRGQLGRLYGVIK